MNRNRALLLAIIAFFVGLIVCVRSHWETHGDDETRRSNAIAMDAGIISKEEFEDRGGISYGPSKRAEFAYFAAFSCSALLFTICFLISPPKVEK